MARLAIITDEISEDMDEVLRVCNDLGIQDLELRSINGASIVDHSDSSIASLKRQFNDHGVRICSIASPFLKTQIGEDQSPIGNVHSAVERSREEHWDILKRSLEIAHQLDAPIVRTFSFWRVDDPESVRGDILETLGRATEITRDADKLLGLENEHACNIGSGTEAAWYLDRLPDRTIGLIWDPGNIAALGVKPDRSQYDAIADRIIHVHVKDGNALPATAFVTPGKGVCDWESQLRWLHDGGYDGPLSIESHFVLDGSREKGAREIAAALRSLAERAGMPLN